MKKTLILSAILALFTFSANAQVCKISDENDNVEVMSANFIDDNTIVVVVSNDSKEISANVTVTVNVTNYNKSGSYHSGTLNLTGRALAKPNGPTEIRIKLPSGCSRRDNSMIDVIGITGTKCR